MKTILFPTDFSEASNRAFVFALNIANHWGATISALHVYSPVDIMDIYTPYGMPEIQEALKQNQFKQYLSSIDGLRKRAEEHGLGNVKIKHILEEGATVKSILHVAKREQAEMIIMGTKGAHGLKEMFLSSIAAEVMEQASCMVLAIPEKAVFDGTIDNIAFTSSYKEEEKKALLQLEAWSKPFDSDIHTVNIDLAHTEFYLNRMDQLEREFKDHENLSFTVVQGNDFFESLTGFLEDREIDILAMVIHKRNFIHELFEYSVTKMMTYHSKTPILAIPSQLLG